VEGELSKVKKKGIKVENLSNFKKVYVSVYSELIEVSRFFKDNCENLKIKIEPYKKRS